MKTGTAVEIYRILKDSKLTGISRNSRFSVVKNMNILRPVADSYDAAWRDAIEKLKPDGYDEMQTRIKEYNAGKGVFTNRDVELANALASEYKNSLEEWRRQEGEKEIECDLAGISMEDIDKIVEANNLSGGDYETLSVLDGTI